MTERESGDRRREADWSAAAWEGARREQMRRWAALPLDRAILARELHVPPDKIDEARLRQMLGEGERA